MEVSQLRISRAALTATVIGAALVLAGCQDGALSSSPSTPPAASTTSAPPDHWTMPNLVGSNLQKAQNAIQKLTGDPVFITGSHDATPRSRHQLLDNDWQVCTQNVKAGTTFNAKTKIDFGAVKTTETCP
jgi:hypothetical protein